MSGERVGGEPPEAGSRSPASLVVFGLTGGVAAGKSTVARRFRERGLSVIDADAIARAVVAPGTAGLDELVEAFGRAILDRTGALDRARLAQVVFADLAERHRLEALVHPRIRAEAERQVAALAARGERLVCYEAALLVEQGLAERYRPLVVVSAPEALQRLRLRARDGLSEVEATQRISAQLPLAHKVALADFVIDNAGRLAETLARADEVLAQVRAHAGRDRPSG